jgi:predicted nucleic acid-binding protein
MTTMMAARGGSAPVLLVDSNVLIYAWDRDLPSKQARAIAVLKAIADAQAGALSTQVLGETYRGLTRRIKSRLPEDQAADHMRDLAAAWPTHDITVRVALEALRGALRHRFPYWDAQLWATARLNQIPIVLSEDFSDGSEIEGVRFVDPFADAFDLDSLLVH